MGDLHDAAIQAGFRALSSADGFPGASYEGCMRDTNIIVTALANDPNVRDGIATLLGSHRQDECVTMYAVRCYCGWNSHALRYPERMGLYRQHVADAILRALGGGDG